MFARPLTKPLALILLAALIVTLFPVFWIVMLLVQFTLGSGKFALRLKGLTDISCLSLEKKA